MPAKHIGASAFQRRFLELLDALPPEGLVITRRGKPGARLIPVVCSNAQLIGCLKGQLQVLGDVLTTDVEWEASRGASRRRA